MSEKTIFKKIIDREIPADIVYEDDKCLAFRDVSPQAPVHILLIPKAEITSLNEVTAENAATIGYLMAVIHKIAEAAGVAETGYRVVSNCGRDAMQSVQHLHFHILGGRGLGWPPG
jgi:histidine triad (HIT) family protein